ncbi:hypothetical protein F0562_018717 [Nyssa sinensis]|uniref:Uncharacterized protein n=1 Tax=Nyssa sinensis TaxID=561372 RepID=A0A5J4ZD55_9ASTE|nr:hypothetical protein F0562_018717 [Nyssa sinensis]
MKDSVSTSGDTDSVEGVGQVMRNLNDGHFKETPKGVDEQDQFYEKVSGCSFLGASVDCTPSQAKHDLAKADDFQITEEINGKESSNKVCDVLVSEENDILKQFLGNQTEDISDALHQGPAACTEDIAESDEGILQNALKSSRASALVDFEIPILDAPCVQESDDVVEE